MAFKDWFKKPYLAGAGPGAEIKRLPGDQVPYREILVRWKGPFDWAYVYRSFVRWFEQRRFRVHENRYKETDKRIKVDGFAVRVIDEFFSETYGFKVEMWDLERKHLKIRGEERIIYNGLCQFRIRPRVKFDQAGFYSDDPTPFRRLIGNLMMDLRWKEIESLVIDTADYRAMDIEVMLKRAFNMSTKENAPWNVVADTNAPPPRGWE